MRHRRRAFLTFAESLFHLTNLLPLHVSDLQSDLFQRTGNDSQRRDIERVAVTPQHLRSDLSGLDAQMLAYIALDERRDIRVVTHSAGQFAGLYPFGRHLESLDITLHRGVPECPFQTKRCNVSMHAVRAADNRRELKLVGAFLQHRHEFLQILADNRVGLFQEVSVGGIYHVGGRQTVVNPLAFFAQRLTHRAGESHHVMPRDLLDLMDAVHVKSRLLTKFGDVLFRHYP